MRAALDLGILRRICNLVNTLSDRHSLLLPGLLCDDKLWTNQVRYLRDTTKASVVDLTQDDTIEAMAETGPDTAPRTFALAGLSMGGYVAQEIMRQGPERVERLALLATNARADTAEKVAIRKDLIRLAEMGKFKDVTPWLLPNLIHPLRLKDPAVADVVMAMAERVGQAAFNRQPNAIMSRRDGRADLAAIRVPTVVICGREDALSSVELHKEMADGIGGGGQVRAH